ncbi:MAG: hypothetical protein WAM14_19455 [Candidatus Nitrosopolaris sp.]
MAVMTVTDRSENVEISEFTSHTSECLRYWWEIAIKHNDACRLVYYQHVLIKGWSKFLQPGTLDSKLYPTILKSLVYCFAEADITAELPTITITRLRN